jgi:intergrase/recombinase
LFKRDLSRVRDLSESVRPNVLKALSALAKFLGCYEDWKVLLKNYGLGWVGRSTDDVIIDRLTRTKDPDEVWDWVRLVKEARPELSVFMDLLAVTGLRFTECVESYNLIIKLNGEGKLGDYYKSDKEALEHYRFKELFLRNTKKAFVSFVPNDLVKTISGRDSLPEGEYIKKLVQRRRLPLRFGDVREAHGTLMTKYLKESEINFLHGRVSSSVFMQHYFNPSLIGDLKERTDKGIAEILEKVEILQARQKI